MDKTAMAIFGFALAVCFIPGWTGGAIATGWVLLSLALPLLYWRKSQLTLEGMLGLFFLAYVGLSLLWTPVPVQGIFSVWQIYVLAFAFCLGTTAVSSTSMYKGIAAGVGISTGLAFFQLYFDWQGIYQFYRPAGLFVNPGVYGEVCALVTIALLASRSYWPTLLTIPGIYFSLSRTAVLACIAAALVFAWDHLSSLGTDRGPLWKNSAILSAAAVLVVSGALLVRSTLIREPNWWTSPAERVAIWQDTVSGLTWAGRGAGSFLITYPVFAKRTDTMATRPEMAHSDVLEWIYEFGLGTIPLGLILVSAFFFSCPERYIFIAFLALMFVSFPTKIPLLGFLGTFALGRLCGSRLMVWSDGTTRGSAEPVGKRGGELAIS